MNRIVKYKRQLRKFCQCCNSERARKYLMTQDNEELVKAVTDIVHNILKGHVKIGNKHRHNLVRYKQQMRHLVVPKFSLKSKRKYLVQQGGFLPFLAPLIPLIVKALAVVGPVIAKGALAGVAGTAASAAIGKIAEKINSNE